MAAKIGVLALQGAFAKHCAMIEALGRTAQLVRRPDHLEGCAGLIIPGGESTTMVRQIAFSGLEEPLKAFAKERPIFGTCAGMILMATQVAEDSVPSLGLIDIAVERNAYGRQTESFSATLTVGDSAFHGVFIRAPQIVDYDRGVEVLATWKDRPVLVKQDRHMAASFHPELTEDTSIHAQFLELC